MEKILLPWESAQVPLSGALYLQARAIFPNKPQAACPCPPPVTDFGVCRRSVAQGMDPNAQRFAKGQLRRIRIMK